MSEASPEAVSVWRRPLVWLVALAVLGLGLRVGAVWYLHGLEQVRIGGRVMADPATQPLFMDSLEYLRVAENLLNGDGLSVDKASQIGRMPGYPVFLAALEAAFGRSNLAVRLAQAAVGTLAVLLSYVLARELFGTRAALAAAALTAVYPAFVAFTVLVLSETLFTVLLLAGAVGLAMAWRRGGLVWPAAAGVGLALATLARGSLLPVAGLVAVGWVAARKPRLGSLQGAVAMLAAFAIAMAPWVVRNWRVTGGHLVLTTLRTGPSLYEGLNPNADGGPMMDQINWDAGTAGMTEWERDQHWRELALDYARQHPGRVAVLALVKLVRFWNVVPNLRSFRSPAICAGLGLPYAAVMVLALVGLVRSWRRADVALILLLPVVYHALVHMVFVGSLRYRVAVMPLVIVLAACGVDVLWSRWQRGRSRTDGDRADVQRGADGGPPAGAGAVGAGGEAGGGGG